MVDNANELRPIRKVFSRIGLALCVILIVASVLQALWFRVPGLSDSSWGMWVGTFAPIYLIAVPIGLFMLRCLPAETPQENKLGGKNFLVFLLIGLCIMYGGNLIGTLISMLLSGGTAQNALLDYTMDNNPLKILVMVILAPLIEEYLFRKQIIDRTRRYGEKTAVFLSAFTFGLFHTNLFQFFYAFGLGLVFAYIYMRTGRLRYGVTLHCMVNFLGSVVAPFILTLVDLEALQSIDVNATAEEVMALYGDMMPGLAIYMLYVLILIGLAITGLVFLILKCRKLVWRQADAQIPRGLAIKTVYWNVGMVLFILLCVGMTIISLL